MIERIVLKFFVIVSAICVLVNDLMILYFVDSIDTSGLGTYKHIVDILLGVGCSICSLLEETFLGT